MLRLAMIGVASLAAVAGASAETTVIQKESSPSVTVTTPTERSTTVVKERSTECNTQVVRKENDLGDSKTVKTTNCD